MRAPLRAVKFPVVFSFYIGSENMVLVSGNSISISRKNSAVIDFCLQNSDGTAFEPTAGDKVIFSVKKWVMLDSFLLQKEKSPTYEGVVSFKFEAEELDLPAGQYVYDLKIFHSDGREETLINPSTFEIIEVVNHD